MEVVLTIFIVGLGSVVLWSLLDMWSSVARKRPPGPYRLPVFGSVLRMLPAVMNSLTFIPKSVSNLIEYKPAYIIMDNISRKYGPITALQFGINSSVLISKGEYAKAVFCREEFGNRFADGWFIERSFGKALGLIFNNGDAYKELKKFTNKNLKDFGFGKKESMEVAVEDELMDFIHDFALKVENSEENVLHMHHTFTLPILNVLWSMIGGTRFSYNDKKLNQIIVIVEELSRSFDIGGNILMAFPHLRHIAPNLTGHSNQMKNYRKLHQFFREIYKQRLSEGFSGNPRDFVDIFLQEMFKNRSEKGQLYTEEQFIMVCLDLFTAGSETTANTLEFAILYMLLNPIVQKKVHLEIDSVIGPSRLPTFQDRLRMPYTVATLLEAQRMCNVIPLVHRVCTADTTLGPYNIKKDDVVIVNLHSIHMDESVYDCPNLFKPERFIDSNGELRSLSQNEFLPFGMGKRVCMGEVLAKLTLFVFFTGMLQRFSFSRAYDHEEPNLKPGRGFTLSPDPFYAYVKLRG